MFLNKYGFLKAHAGRVVSYWAQIYPERSIKTVSDLAQLIYDEKLKPADFYHIRGCGNPRQPGKIVLFLFQEVKSPAEQRAEKADLMAGGGI